MRNAESKMRRETRKSNANQKEAYSAFQPSQRFNLALPLPFGPDLTLEPSRADSERLELRPNSYCRLLPGRPPLAFALLCASLHSSLQNHFVLPIGALSRLTQAR